MNHYTEALKLLDDIIANCSTTEEHIARRRALPADPGDFFSRRYARNISLRESEDIGKLPDNTVLISIASQPDHRGCPNVPKNKRFNAKFDDVTAPQGNIAQPITDIQATAMVRWIRQHSDANFIVHCRAGVSRSAAVCLFIHTIYGHALRPNFWEVSRPNPFVLGMLLREHCALSGKTV